MAFSLPATPRRDGSLLPPWPTNSARVAAHPDYRGKQLGTKICAAVLIFYRQAGVRHVALHTDDFRKPALVTYLRQGWQPVIDDEEMAARWQAVRDELGIAAAP